MSETTYIIKVGAHDPEDIARRIKAAAAALEKIRKASGYEHPRRRHSVRKAQQRRQWARKRWL